MLQMQLLTLPPTDIRRHQGKFSPPPPHFGDEINVTERKAHCTAARRKEGGKERGSAGWREGASGQREERVERSMG